jgi:large subunit ribosomal protein L4e
VRVSHKRHEWKGHYGKGISRVPRKTMWRRGTQFYWIGAEVSGARGGRRVHGPTIFKHYRKINKNEQKLALQSALAATAQEKFLAQRYPTLKTINAGVQSVAQLPTKTSQLVELMEKVFNTSRATPQQKVTRAGIGKRRGRRFKVNAGALVIVGKDEQISNYKHLDVKTTKSVTLQDLYPLGRFTLYTQKALEELQNAI